MFSQDFVQFNKISIAFLVNNFSVQLTFCSINFVQFATVQWTFVHWSWNRKSIFQRCAAPAAVNAVEDSSTSVEFYNWEARLRDNSIWHSVACEQMSTGRGRRTDVGCVGPRATVLARNSSLTRKIFVFMKRKKSRWGLGGTLTATQVV